mmetsp:Transcript_3511/g.8299  ORF Transcript_3511/g.8299 Transcript_3511/m.8299 type:complete len:177 (+) Transcript_3511:179-709(+)
MVQRCWDTARWPFIFSFGHPSAVGAPRIDVEQPAHSGVLRQGIPALGKLQQAICWFIRTVFACYACSVELVDLEQEIEQAGKAMVLCYVDHVLIISNSASVERRFLFEDRDLVLQLPSPEPNCMPYNICVKRAHVVKQSEDGVCHRPSQGSGSAEEVRLEWIPGSQNPADLFTKND